MYNTSYEEYMRTVLGYTPNCIQDTYQVNDYYDRNYYTMDSNLENMYPEIYKVVYPLICKECSNVGYEQVNEELIEKMTNNVINSINIDLKIQTNNRDAKKEDRQIAPNRFLNDLIRILILRELLNRPRPHFPQRPPMPPRPRPIF